MPERRCLATGEVLDTRLLLRFVVAPDGRVVPDVAGDLPGRGMWLRPEPAAIAKAVRKGLFARAARRAVAAEMDLVERARDLVRRRCLDYLGLARRSGQALAGLEKVRVAIAADRVAVLIQARDGSAWATRKLPATARAIPMVALFDRSELGLALGRRNVVHAALAPGRLAERFAAECGRLACLETTDGTGSETEKE